MRSNEETAAYLKGIVNNLPETPGCYQYLDESGTIIYVGKAKNLKRRVSSYFNKEQQTRKTRLLVARIRDIRYVVVKTEEDALLLENNLIKRYKPHYNVLLKDDKTYPSIAVTTEYLPRIFKTRQRGKRGAVYFGPYSHVPTMYALLNLCRELYQPRPCRTPMTREGVMQGKYQVCLDYHIHRCKGPCVGRQSHEDYLKAIEACKEILKGNTGEVQRKMRDEIVALAAELRFEEAQELKEQYQKVERYQAKSAIVSPTLDDLDVFGIDDDGSNDVYINYMHVQRGAVSRSLTLQYKRRLDESRQQLLSYAMAEVARTFSISYDEVIVAQEPDSEFVGATFTVPQRGDKAKLLDVSQRNARQRRVEDLGHLERTDPAKRAQKTLERIKADFRLSELPVHIECFDNSNIQGTNPVASCVVFRDAKPSKKDYRHFNIKTVVGADDFASMKEVLTRRYTRLMNETPDDLPQLIVVDGGKGQLSSAVEALDEMGLRGKIAVVGIAKRLEEIYFPGDSVPLYIDKNSESLKVVQHLRDEAHRFGITHHRDRRSKSQIVSELSGIKGIGKITEQELLRHFKSVKRISEASLDALAAVIGPAKARLVRAHFAANAR